MQLHFYLLLYWLYTQQKLLQCCTSCVNMIQRGIEGCLFSISSGKTESIEAMNSQLWAGWLEAYATVFVRHILKSRVLKLIYFHQQMGQDP